jgi:hypothetical protein
LPATEERAEIRELIERESAELRCANEMIVSVFRDRARCKPTEVRAFIDEHRARFGVEPICRTLGVSASAYYRRASGKRCAHAVEDERLTARIRRLHGTATTAAGGRAALERAGEHVGRDHVARLMRCAGLHGAKRRGKGVAHHDRRSRGAEAPSIGMRAQAEIESLLCAIVASDARGPVLAERGSARRRASSAGR